MNKNKIFMKLGYVSFGSCMLIAIVLTYAIITNVLPTDFRSILSVIVYGGLAILSWKGADQEYDKLMESDTNA